MIYWNSKKSENLGQVGEELVVWERGADSLSQPRREVLKDIQVPREVQAKI
jgi:hypothetical protein